MNKTARHTIQSRFALLFLVVFVGSMLVKPVHVLLAQHNHTSGIVANGHEALTTNNYKDCAICDFEFCTFIPQQAISLPQTTLYVCCERACPTVDCLANTPTHLFRLRAPPAL